MAQIADFLMTHEKMRWAIATGRYQGRLYVSLRANDSSGGAGRLIKRLLGGGNRGGGHSMIAGGSLDVGLDAPEHEWSRVEGKITDAVLQSQGIKDPSQRLYPFRGERF